MAVCSLIDIYKSRISLIDAKAACHFHSAPYAFAPLELGPGGLCPEAYYLFYPYLFALVYGADLDLGRQGPFSLTCPHPEIEMKFQIIKTRPALREQMKNIIKSAIANIYQVAMQRLNIALMPTGSARLEFTCCPHPGMEKDKVYRINFGNLKGLCPAALRSIFPYLACNYLRKKSGKDYPAKYVACPDHIKRLRFKIGHLSDEKKAKEPFNEKNHLEICNVPGGIQIQRISDENGLFIKDLSYFSIIDMTRKINFPCPVLLNVAFPYYLAVSKNGKLGFYTGSFKSAMIQCPNPEVGVQAKICKVDSNIEFRITDVEGKAECPCNIKKGDILKISAGINKDGFSLEDFNLLFFYSMLAGEVSKPFIVKSIINKSVFKVTPSMV